MATRISESAVVNAKIGAVWELVRPLTFAYFGKRVGGVKLDAEGHAVGGIRTVTYTDGTVQKLKLTALSDAQRTVAWDVVESTPAITVLSVAHSVRLYRVTESDTTYVEWETLFSKDVTAAVLEDARYKQREHFAALEQAVGTKPKAAAASAAAVADRKDEKAAPAAAGAAAAAAGGAVFEWETPKREMLEDATKTLELALPLAANPSGFTKIRLSGHSFSPAAALAMAPVLEKTTALRVVDISDVIAVRSTPDVVAALTTLTTAVAKNNKNITEVNVSDNALGFAGVKACAPVLSQSGAGIAKLQVLKFNNNGLEGDAAEFITKTIVAASGKPTALRHFEIHNNCLADAGGIGLAPLFAASPLLERIRFTTTRLSEDGGNALVKSLVDGGSHAFVSIELSDNGFGEDAGLLFAQKVIPDQPRLQVLNIADTGFGAKAVGLVLEALHKTAPELQALDLSNLELGDAKLAAKVAELIKAKPKLTRVALEGNDLGNKGVLTIVKALADSHADLQELNLSGNALKTTAIPAIMEALKNKPNLKKLSLNSNQFTTKGVAAIKAAVKALGLPAKALDTLSENEDDDDDDAADDAADKLAVKLATLSIKK